MKDIWTQFCAQSECGKSNYELCNAWFEFVINPSSCVNHALRVCFNLLLLIVLFYNLFCKFFFKKVELEAGNGLYFSLLRIISAVFNGCLGLVFIGLGFYVFAKSPHSIIAVDNSWITILFHGVTWVLVGVTLSLRGHFFLKSPIAILGHFGFCLFWDFLHTYCLCCISEP